MKIEWTPSGGSKVTLGDDASRQTVRLLAMGGQVEAQVAGLFRGTYPYVAGRGNVSGVLECEVSQSYASYDAALDGYKTEYGRIGQEGTLKLTEGAKSVSFTGALLRAVERSGQVGLRWSYRYSFVTKGVS